ncbi:DNA-binding response regulator [Nostoc sp. 3335mG]|nr:DNA-binding response regulator [Nostoc sp. 3335mG]
MPQAIEIGGRPVRLTPTQMKVMRGVHSGQLNKQIAYELGIAEATVKAHMTALMRKLNVRNRTQVAIAAEAMAHPLS